MTTLTKEQMIRGIDDEVGLLPVEYDQLVEMSYEDVKQDYEDLVTFGLEV